MEEDLTGFGNLVGLGNSRKSSILKKVGKFCNVLQKNVFIYVETLTKQLLMISANTISEAKLGNRLAQRSLYESLCPFARLICERYMKYKEDTEDMMQEGFLRFFKGLKDFRYESNGMLFAYTREIMANVCIRQLNKKNVLRTMPETDIPDIAVDEEAICKMDDDKIFAMILCLPVVYRTVFNMYVIENFSHKKIAGLLNIKENLSRTRLSRAKVLMQKMVTIKEINYEKEGR